MEGESSHQMEGSKVRVDAASSKVCHMYAPALAQVAYREGACQSGGGGESIVDGDGGGGLL